MPPQTNHDDDAAQKRNKKRELDRRAQRAARARNRNRIANLEATIDLMSSNESGLSVTTLLNQINDVTKERDQLACTLHSIADLIKRGVSQTAPGVETRDETRDNEPPCRGLHDSSLQDSPRQPQAPMVMLQTPVSNVPTDAPFETQSFSSPISAFHGAGSDIPCLGSEYSQQGGSQDGLLEPSIAAADADNVIIPESKYPCDCLPSDSATRPTLDSSKSIWRAANSILGQTQPLKDCDLETEDEICEDLPIKAILNGWGGVEGSMTASPLWDKLRRIDKLQFRGCPDVERLAILVLMHRVLRYRADPDHVFGDKFPPWLLQRPSQSLPHSSAIDFFVWPGVRERFVFSQHQYCSNSFWKVFVECFRVSWPFEFRDCYMTNVVTGRYSLSPQFESHIQNITSWTMTLDFFTHFPEMYGDIPTFQEVPRLLPDPRQRRRLPHSEEDDDSCSSLFKSKIPDARNDVLSFLSYH
ncbi:hypothetical protein FZEAL_5026 [Fusarium zealandicum]|uniref:BZIP transcription factor n=1 Tax=Fusarium zealandicum TaxID=1053134 RepID=A0A8H4UKK2_9HYPO|nr:hypothetical protein FZEAL_5026 [Fusarium zealandicum]